MANEILRRDENSAVVLAGVTDDASNEIRMLRVDPVTGRLLVSSTGSSSVNDSDIAFTDITTGNASSSKHGFLPKLSNSLAQFLNGQGSWTSTIDSNTSASPTLILQGTGTGGRLNWRSASKTFGVLGADSSSNYGTVYLGGNRYSDRQIGELSFLDYANAGEKRTLNLSGYYNSGDGEYYLRFWRQGDNVTTLGIGQRKVGINISYPVGALDVWGNGNTELDLNLLYTSKFFYDTSDRNRIILQNTDSTMTTNSSEIIWAGSLDEYNTQQTLWTMGNDIYQNRENNFYLYNSITGNFAFKVDENGIFQIGTGLRSVDGSQGVTGSFSTGSQTIQVKNGIITSIV